MRLATLFFVLFVCAAAQLPAQIPPLPAAGSRLFTESSCAAELGEGIRTRRTYCDVIITDDARASITMRLPARQGAATLYFDLHNRFDLPADDDEAGVSYVRHLALVRVVDGAGETIGRAGVVREFRTLGDLFDRLGGGGRPAGLKGVAPGPPDAIRISVPAGPTTIGIVGESVSVRYPDGRDERFDAPGRPVAIASNIRLEYRPR
ncbi:MAG: hypothetical protein DIU54_006085 [Acidobacteriota bacterium]|jgi:hypothetical protein|nr:MAG: hypothetical protein DIU54_00465 [Acidobacteriota bacterium]